MGGYKLWALPTGQEAKNITDLSWFYVALTGMVLGAQFFLAGFLAEMVSRNDPRSDRLPCDEGIEPLNDRRVFTQTSSPRASMPGGKLACRDAALRLVKFHVVLAVFGVD